MKAIITLILLGCLFGAAIFVAILMGAGLAHFTNPILGGVATFPFAVSAISGARWFLARIGSRETPSLTQSA